jgi:hypothetical protein
MPEDGKYCAGCGATKARSEFYKNRAKGDGLTGYCKLCTNERHKGRYQRSPDAAWARQIRFHYKLTVERYNEILRAQGGVCASCHQPETVRHLGRLKRLAVDHDHACCPGKDSCGTCIRGLLCANCNQMVGCARDNPSILESGADYLRHTLSDSQPTLLRSVS